MLLGNRALGQSQVVVLACIFALVVVVFAQAKAKLNHYYKVNSDMVAYQNYNKVRSNMAAFRRRYPQVDFLTFFLDPGADAYLMVYVEVALELSLYVIPLALLQATFLGISVRKLLVPATATDRTQGAVGVGYVVAAALAEAATHNVVRFLFDLADARVKGKDVFDFFRSIE